MLILEGSIDSVCANNATKRKVKKDSAELRHLNFKVNYFKKKFSAIAEGYTPRITDFSVARIHYII